MSSFLMEEKCEETETWSDADAVTEDVQNEWLLQ